jgi:hypothetical protein
MKTNILKVTPPFDQMAVDALAGCHLPSPVVKQNNPSRLLSPENITLEYFISLIRSPGLVSGYG